MTNQKIKKQEIKRIKITEKWLMPILDIEQFCNELLKLHKQGHGFTDIEWHVGEFPIVSYHKKI